MKLMHESSVPWDTDPEASATARIERLSEAVSQFNAAMAELDDARETDNQLRTIATRRARQEAFIEMTLSARHVRTILEAGAQRF